MCLLTLHHHPGCGHIANWTVESCIPFSNSVRKVANANRGISCADIESTHDLLTAPQYVHCEQCTLDLAEASGSSSRVKPYIAIEGLTAPVPVVEVEVKMFLFEEEKESNYTRVSEWLDGQQNHCESGTPGCAVDAMKLVEEEAGRMQNEDAEVQSGHEKPSMSVSLDLADHVHLALGTFLADPKYEAVASKTGSDIHSFTSVDITHAGMEKMSEETCSKQEDPEAHCANLDDNSVNSAQVAQTMIGTVPLEQDVAYEADEEDVPGDGDSCFADLDTLDEICHDLTNETPKMDHHVQSNAVAHSAETRLSTSSDGSVQKTPRQFYSPPPVAHPEIADHEVSRWSDSEYDEDADYHSTMEGHISSMWPVKLDTCLVTTGDHASLSSSAVNLRTPELPSAESSIYLGRFAIGHYLTHLNLSPPTVESEDPERTPLPRGLVNSCEEQWFEAPDHFGEGTFLLSDVEPDSVQSCRSSAVQSGGTPLSSTSVIPPEVAEIMQELKNAGRCVHVDHQTWM